VVAKRRKVGNLLALAVLSTLIGKPMHPYEIASVLRERGKDQDLKVKWGSLYTVVQNLEKHGFVAATESVRQGGRPERTVYRITEAGHAELEDWVRELVAVPEPEYPRFKAGLSNLMVVNPDDAVQLLEQRLNALEAHLAGAREGLAKYSLELPRLLLIEAEYDLALLEAETTWTRSLLDELKSGAMPGVEQWRAWHETGELPAELVEMAERGTTGSTDK
jgi:DNA-binding PadR family transcriptional regulator